MASQVSILPFDQGTSVRPSGRLASDLRSPLGSLVEGISALVRARQTMSLIMLCLGSLLALLVQESPWIPDLSTAAPHPQTWGSHNLQPRRKPIATLTASSFIRSPHAAIGSALSHSLPCSAETASRRAHPRGSSSVSLRQAIPLATEAASHWRWICADSVGGGRPLNKSDHLSKVQATRGSGPSLRSASMSDWRFEGDAASRSQKGGRCKQSHTANAQSPTLDG